MSHPGTPYGPERTPSSLDFARAERSRPRRFPRAGRARMRRSLVCWLTVAASLFVVLFAGPAHAIPAFARRYQTGCATCHVLYPKLNAFGEAFRRNGYRFPGDDELAQMKQPPFTLVAGERRELFPDSEWPTDLPSYPPLVLVLNGVVPIYPDKDARPAGEEIITFDRIFRSALLVAGARFGEDIAVFGEIGLAPKDGVTLGRGFLMVSNLFGGPWMSLRVGQFDPQVASFSSARRVGGPAYRILGDALAPGAWSLEPMVRGVGLSGTMRGRVGYDVAYAQGVVGGAASEAIRQVPKDAYAHVYTKLGGLRLDAVEEAGNGREESVTFGVFGFRGVHAVDTDADDETDPEDDSLYKIGGDADARLGRFELLAAGAYEKHRFEVQGSVHRTQALVEATAAIFPWLVGGARWETEAGSGGSKRRLVPLLVAHPRLNIKTFAFASIEQGGVDDGDFHVAEINLGGSYAF